MSHYKEIVKHLLEISNTFVELLIEMIKIIFDYEDLYHVQLYMYHWCLAPSIDIANLAAHKFELQTLVHPRGKIFWQSVFGLEIFCPEV